MNRAKQAILLPLVLGLSACSGSWFPTLDDVFPDKQRDYQKSEALPDLEVPPDLSTEAIKDTTAIPAVDKTGAATFSTYEERAAKRRDQQTRKEKQEEVDEASALREEEVPEPHAVRHEGVSEDRHEPAADASDDEQRIVVKRPPAVIWPKLREFWRKRGYYLALDDAELGVLETNWRESLSKGMRDQFKLFVEPGRQAGTSALYLSHSGESSEPGAAGEEPVWRAREVDPAVQRGMIEELQRFLAGAKPAPVQKTQQAYATRPGKQRGGQRAELVRAGQGKQFLRMGEDFMSAWQRTHRALKGAGIQVTESDRTKGVFKLHFIETQEVPPKEPGFFSSLAFWKGDDEGDYELHLSAVGEHTELVVLDDDGDWDSSAAANRILELLERELNK
ncbi:MAG: outer membrane protein assembly factor BamC [Gammaproteobacteria bacterium]